jgi:DNA repair exonuclease SbcCD ATPase subunit
MEALVKELPAKIKSYEDRVEAIDTYKSESRKYEKWKTGYDARVAANVKARDALKDITAPDGDKEELKKWLLDFEELESRLEAAKTGLATAKQAESTAELRLEAAKNRVAEIAQGVADNTEEPSVVEKAKRRLAEHEVANNTLAQLRGEAKVLERNLTDKQAELKKLKNKLKRSKKLKLMAYTINIAREVMHRDRLPKRVALANLARMEGDVNEGLAFFGDPYWVEANSELSFTIHKPGEPPQAAGRLSTGQRVVLALSFWPAVASLWSSDLGMLALDEPTANLDADNRKFLAQALSAMTAKVRNNRQLIMVTHDPDLRTSFDQVIDLGG